MFLAASCKMPKKYQVQKLGQRSSLNLPAGNQSFCCSLIQQDTVSMLIVCVFCGVVPENNEKELRSQRWMAAKSSNQRCGFNVVVSFCGVKIGCVICFFCASKQPSSNVCSFFPFWSPLFFLHATKFLPLLVSLFPPPNQPKAGAPSPRKRRAAQHRLRSKAHGARHSRRRARVRCRASERKNKSEGSGSRIARSPVWWTHRVLVDWGIGIGFGS